MAVVLSAKSEPRTVIDRWKENWASFFLLGYLFSILVATTQVAFLFEQIEIHYRLFLMMLLTTLSFGGFLLTILPWPLATLICVAGLICNRRSQLLRWKVK